MLGERWVFEGVWRICCSEDVYVSSLTISSTTHRTYSLRNDSRLSNPPSRGSRATSRVLNRMSSRGNDQTNSTISTRYRTTVGRKEDNSNVFARRESRRAFGACIPVHIYTQLLPPKIPKTINKGKLIWRKITYENKTQDNGFLLIHLLLIH